MDKIFKCELCNREFNRKESLTRHINTTHLHINISTKHICKLCGEETYKGYVGRHLKLKHNYNEYQVFEYTYLFSRTTFNYVPSEILKYYLKKLWNINKGKKDYNKQFKSFYGMITYIRNITENDIDVFFSTTLPYKQKRPQECNSKELCNAVFPYEKENAERLYNETMKVKNPFTNHGGIYSPYSKKFIGYKGKTDEEIKELRYKAGRHDMIGRNINQKEYWMKRGYSEEESIKKAREHINIFSLETCISKYGEEEGYKRWKDRQIKWQKTMNSKSPEEIQRINHSKIYRNGSTSILEKEFLNSIITDDKCFNVYIKDLKLIVDLLYGDKVIEFYGDYWHCNPNIPRFTADFYHQYLNMTAKEKWEFDADRVKRLKDNGYEVKIVWETDYLSQKEKIINECKEFLGVK